jgi:hypothetical protein
VDLAESDLLESIRLSVLLPHADTGGADPDRDTWVRRTAAQLEAIYGPAEVETVDLGDGAYMVTALSRLLTHDQAADVGAARALGDFLRSQPEPKEHGCVHVLLGRSLFSISMLEQPATIIDEGGNDEFKQGSSETSEGPRS